MRKLKIGIYSFNSFLKPSGQTTRMINILKRLSNIHKVTVYCPFEENESLGEMYKIKDESSITVKNFNFKLNHRNVYNDFNVHRFLEKEYKKDNFDILQLENSFGALNLLSKGDFPMVGVFHARELEELSYGAQLQLSKGHATKYLVFRLFGLYAYLCEKKLAQNVARVIVPSELVKQYAIYLGADPSVIRLLPNGVNLNEYRNYASSVSKYDLRKKLKLPEDAFIFVFHGSLCFDQNIEAIKNILKIRNMIGKQKSAKNYYFLIVGGPIKQIEKVWAAKVTDFDNVLFKGYVQDVKPYLFSADCGLAPFPEDAQPGGPRLKILEFLAAGLPVITTKTGICGLEELMDDQPIYLFEKITDIKELPPNLISRGNREKLERFDWSNIAKENEKILKEVIQS